MTTVLFRRKPFDKEMYLACPNCDSFRNNSPLKFSGHWLNPEDLGGTGFGIGTWCNACSWAGVLGLVVAPTSRIVELGLMKAREGGGVVYDDPRLRSITPYCPGCENKVISFCTDGGGFENALAMPRVIHNLIECAGTLRLREECDTEGNPLDPVRLSCGWTGTLTLRVKSTGEIGFRIAELGDFWLIEVGKRLLLGETRWERFRNRVRL